MTVEEPTRILPVTTAQLVGQTSSDLGKVPGLLGIVVILIVGMASAVYFLNLLISGQQEHLKALLAVQDRQQTEIIEMHAKEFDALLELASRSYNPPVMPPLPPTAPDRSQRGPR